MGRETTDGSCVFYKGKWGETNLEPVAVIRKKGTNPLDPRADCPFLYMFGEFPRWVELKNGRKVKEEEENYLDGDLKLAGSHRSRSILAGDEMAVDGDSEIAWTIQLDKFL